jgi:hypothetical protein
MSDDVASVGNEKCIKNLIGNPRKSNYLGDPGIPIRKDNIKTDVKQVCENVNWIHVA